jgi:Replication initiator protein A
MKFQTLFEKSGAEGEFRRFKFELMKIIQRNDLPGFDIFLEIGSSAEPSLRMIPQNPRQPAPAAVTKAEKTTRRPDFPHLSDVTLSLIRKKFPGNDVYALKADFDAWLGEKEMPNDYQKAFYGFVEKRMTRPNV